MTTINWHERAEQADLSVLNVVNGDTVTPQGAEEIEKYSPRDGRLLYRFAEGNAEEVDKAVAAGRAAFNDGRWSRLPIAKRAAILVRFAELIEANGETLGLYDCLDVGKPISKAVTDDIARAAQRLRGAAALVPALEAPSATDLGHMCYQRCKPLGCVGAIVGWNYPLAMAAGRAAPVLLMGNSLVLKPSEFSALSTWHLATLALEAGVPPGVFNVVNGAGHTVGAALSSHPDVDMLSFVGSGATGRQIMSAAGASNMKRVQLECGGKSPYIVFDDCPEDLDFIAQDIVDTAFPNQGALCVAGSRLLIQKGIREKLMPLVIEKSKAIRAGDPLDSKTPFGALVNEGHMNKVLAYIESGTKEGAELLCGGERVCPDGNAALKNGYYIEPTIFDGVSPTAKIAQEEIFGPVLSVLTFEDEAEAISLANNTQYGLAAYAATTNLGRAQRLGEYLDTGTLVTVGGTQLSGGAPGLSSDKHKQSGFGFSGGVNGLKAFSVTTTVRLYT